MAWYLILKQCLLPHYNSMSPLGEIVFVPSDLGILGECLYIVFVLKFDKFLLFFCDFRGFLVHFLPR